MNLDITIKDADGKTLYELDSDDATTLGHLRDGIGIQGSLRNQATLGSMFNPNTVIRAGTYYWVPAVQQYPSDRILQSKWIPKETLRAAPSPMAFSPSDLSAEERLRRQREGGRIRQRQFRERKRQREAGNLAAPTLLTHSPPELSAEEILLQKREADRIRQQRCRERKRQREAGNDPSLMAFKPSELSAEEQILRRREADRIRKRRCRERKRQQELEQKKKENEEQSTDNSTTVEEQSTDNSTAVNNSI